MTTARPTAREAAPRQPPAPRRWWARVRSDVLLAAVVALVVVPVLQPLMAQQASRYALTAALADQGTVVIDAYAEYVTVDRAEREGRLYSDKAPGQPVLGVPAYLAYRAFGGAPATQALPLGDLGLWSVNLVSAALPAVALAVLMRRLALRVAPRGATPAALGMALATMLLPFATVLFSHVLSAALGLAAYLLLTRAGGDGRVPGWAIAGSGLLAGLAVTVEFTMGLLAAVLGVTGLALHRWRTWWYVLGGVVPALLLGWYNAVAFGGPLTLSYEFSGFAQHQDGLVGAQLPRLASTVTVLFSERGLLTLTPLVAVGVIGCLALLRSGARPGAGAASPPRACRRDALVALAVLAAFVALMGGWSNPTGGASPGPRYVVPALPFLAGGVAWVFERARAWAAAAAVAGGAAMGLATFTLPLAQQPFFEPVALRYWLGRAADGQWADTLLTRATSGGGVWLLPPLLLAAALTAWLLATDARSARSAA
ncbi:MAG: hypothetical protein H0V93_14950 [Euzebyales bacterium]|nr:hypothetical protein [Euzebyales bacterium]